MKRTRYFKVMGIGDLQITYDFIPGALGYTDPDNPSHNVPALEPEVHITGIHLKDSDSAIQLVPVPKDYSNEGTAYPEWLTKQLLDKELYKHSAWV